LNSLYQSGLIQVEGSRGQLANSLRATLQQALQPEQWFEWLLHSVLRTLNQMHSVIESSETLSYLDAGITLLKWASSTNRWEAVIRLAKSLDPILTLNKRWGAWEQVLQAALEAATAMENLTARAWVLHQLGTRAMCLGDDPLARRLLVKALRLRRLLHDASGEKLTRHNLDLLLGSAPGPDRGNDGSNGPRPKQPQPKSFKPLALKFVIGTLFVTAALASVALGVSNDPPQSPVPSPTYRGPEVVSVQATSTYTPDPGSPTVSPAPTNTNTLPPKATNTAAPTETFTPVPTRCGPFPGWVLYQIRPGDNLFRLSLNTHTTVEQVMLANCLSGTTIYAGSMLWLPFIPPEPATETPEPTITPTNTPTPPTPTIDPYYVPDLEVSIWEGRKWIDESGIFVELLGEVINQGPAPADWPIQTGFSYEYEPPIVSTYLPDPPNNPQGRGDFPQSANLLGRGESLPLKFTLEFDHSWSGYTLVIQAGVNTCQNGSELCSWPEVNTQNNTSDVLRIQLIFNY